MKIESLLRIILAGGLLLTVHCFNVSSEIVKQTRSEMISMALSIPFGLSRKTLSLPTKKSSQLQAASGDEPTSDEVKAVRKTILSVSEEGDDEKRRSNLSSLINQKISEDDQQFLQIWDKAIIQLGEELQAEARVKITETQATQTEGSSDASDEAKEGEKSKEELQLWALIDMMIQSKTLIKKASQ